MLSALPAGNPVGFLAAVGALSATDRAFAQMRPTMGWVQGNTGWTPELSLNADLSIDELVEGIHRELAALSRCGAFSIADDLSIPVNDFRKTTAAGAAASSAADRLFVDYLSAFGSEAIEAAPGGKPNGLISDTAFRTMSGSGHQHFLGAMRTFIEDTTVEHLRSALFDNWTYNDPVEKHSMRWDPVDDVRYALRWRNPSGDPGRKSGGSSWGANLLAIEGFRHFPTMPVTGSLRTTGFSHWKRRGTYWTWPIWTGQIQLETIRSLVALRELQIDDLGNDLKSREKLRQCGVREVFRVQRITQGKFRNFGHAYPV
jgi:hypothetical protein